MELMNRFITFARKHILLFGAAKFIAGLAIGFAVGIYTLPILIAEQGLSQEQLADLNQQTVEQVRTGSFSKDNPGSDLAHWGQGTIYVTDDRIWLDGKVSPGPDYRLYLTRKQVSSKQAFLDIKDQSTQIAPIKAFKNFSIDVPDSVSVDDYEAVIIWCERFGAFITSARLS